MMRNCKMSLRFYFISRRKTAARFILRFFFLKKKINKIVIKWTICDYFTLRDINIPSWSVRDELRYNVSSSEGA